MHMSVSSEYHLRGCLKRFAYIGDCLSIFSSVCSSLGAYQILGISLPLSAFVILMCDYRITRAFLIEEQKIVKAFMKQRGKAEAEAKKAAGKVQTHRRLCNI